MATTFKTITADDNITSRTLLHEHIPITGSIVSGTYNDENIKTYAHGMFQSVFDYPFLSSSANHLFDVTFGYANDSDLSASTNSQNAKKINIYNQMAQVLMGHDESGSIRQFDRDGNIVGGGTKLKETVFFNFSRLIVKDEIKKGSFSLKLNLSGATSAPENDIEFKDFDATANSNYFTNSPAGEYGILYTSSVSGERSEDEGFGLIFYQAGVCVLTASVFSSSFVSTTDDQDVPFGSQTNANDKGWLAVATGSDIDAFADGVRNRFYNVSFNNTTELNSSIYFCRVNHNDFNYSSNPTYVDTDSQIRVKNQSGDQPVSYITTVGLYSADNELLAVAKLSEPLKKTPSEELTLRVRLDY
tara:strand:- start:1522 stop:2598 length:1077 start_codon:yes stop_codon:yes gene_type:complete